MSRISLVISCRYTLGAWAWANAKHCGYGQAPISCFLSHLSKYVFLHLGCSYAPSPALLSSSHPRVSVYPVCTLLLPDHCSGDDNMVVACASRFTDDPAGSGTTNGAPGSAVYYLGRFYDNIFVKRKGVTSLSWPKPKLKFKLPKAVCPTCPTCVSMACACCLWM